jgi:Fatty acid desaturase
MASQSALQVRGGVYRTAGRDGLLIASASFHAVLLLAAPILPVIAVGVWWNSNTISHNFIHRPFFRSRPTNILFAAGLSLLLGIPQSLWRDRHLAHHAGVPPRVRLTSELWAQTALIFALWAAIVVRAPVYFFSVYVPGYLLGLALCAVHGHYEHAHGATSYYGKLYNLLFFNDGYHVEHHSNPAAHWTRLPDRFDSTARRSAWPAPLRWIEECNLDTLERLLLGSPVLQRFVLRTHERALRSLLASAGTSRPQRVGIIGGGLFPRTALILRALLPEASITIIDASRENLDCARHLLRAPEIEFRHERYDGGGDFDLVVLPLAFRGDRAAICAHPPTFGLIVHDWIWHRWGSGHIVSLALLKRIYLVRP